MCSFISRIKKQHVLSYACSTVSGNLLKKGWKLIIQRNVTTLSTEMSIGDTNVETGERDTPTPSRATSLTSTFKILRVPQHGGLNFNAPHMPIYLHALFPVNELLRRIRRYGL